MAASRFARAPMWALIGVFVVDLAVPFVPLTSLVLVALAAFWPRGLAAVADFLRRAAEEA